MLRYNAKSTILPRTGNMTAPMQSTPNFRHKDVAGLFVAPTNGDFTFGTQRIYNWMPGIAEPQSRNYNNIAVSTMTIRLLDPIDDFLQQLDSRYQDLSDTVSAYDDRISTLEDQASVEGIFLSSRSRETLLEFFKKNPLIRRGRLYLLENGNFRAVWKGEAESHVALQFLENGFIQYVLFKRRDVRRPTSRVYGRDTPDGVLKQIAALQLNEVLYR